MTDKQPEALRLAALLEKTGAKGSLRDEAASELRRQHTELETLRTGYEAARLEIESLRARSAEPAGEYPALPNPGHRGPGGTGSYFDSFTADQMRAYADATCAIRAAQPAGAQQPCTAELVGALEDAQRAIASMKVEAETAAQGDEQMMLDACETISSEGLQADVAIRAALESHWQAPAQAAPDVSGYVREWASGICTADEAMVGITKLYGAQAAPQQEAQEPVAWYVTGCGRLLDEDEANAEARHIGGTARAIPLYTAPQQYEALIRQLVEALEGYRRNHNDTQPCDAERAGRAWLEGKK